MIFIDSPKHQITGPWKMDENARRSDEPKGEVLFTALECCDAYEVFLGKSVAKSVFKSVVAVHLQLIKGPA